MRGNPKNAGQASACPASKSFETVFEQTLFLMLAALTAGAGCPCRVILEVAAAGRSALAGDLALLAVAHSCESTSFGHDALLSIHESGPTSKCAETVRVWRKRM